MMASRVFWKIYRHLQQEANASAQILHLLSDMCNSKSAYWAVVILSCTKKCNTKLIIIKHQLGSMCGRHQSNHPVEDTDAVCWSSKDSYYSIKAISDICAVFCLNQSMMRTGAELGARHLDVKSNNPIKKVLLVTRGQ